MGILGKLVGVTTQLVTSKGATEKITTSVGNVISNKMIAKCEAELKELEVSFELDKQDYLKRKEKLMPKVQQGDKRALKKLQNLENEFKIIVIEYNGDRNAILAKQPKLEEKHKLKINEEDKEKLGLINGVTQNSIQANIKCQNCGHEIPEGVKFCSNCGAEIKKKYICSNCGTELSPNSNFCSSCGQKR